MSKAGWQTKNFSDVLDIKNGRNQKEVESDSGEYPIYGSAGNVMGYANSYICEAGTTIVGRKGNINSPIYAETRFWNVDTAFGLAAKPGLDSKFLYYYCISYDFSVLNRGTTIPSLVKSELLGISIPVPPLPEQQRIVAILDAAFDHIATARANCEANLLNARAIFVSHLQAVFTQGGKGWTETNLGSVCDLFQGLCINAKTKHLLVEKSDLPLLRIKDLRQNNAEQFVAESGWPKSAYVTEEEIIYTRTGQIGLVFRGRVGVLHNNCFKVKPRTSLNADYIFWWLQNPAFRARIGVLASKTAQPDITHTLFKAQPILLPPRSYQEKAIEKIDAVRTETQRLVSLYQRKLQALDDLKKSLLHQAFSRLL
jgi:type I restriction enzyme, S subunit